MGALRFLRDKQDWLEVPDDKVHKFIEVFVTEAFINK